MPATSSKIYTYSPHPHIEHRKKKAPTKEPAPKPKRGLARFNAWLAVKITSAVGTMWCAYAFTGLALVSLPGAVRGGTVMLVSWIAQTFLQLVLLSIIIVGQKVDSEASETRAIDTYKDAEAVLHEAMEIQHHLVQQDMVLQRLLESLGNSTTPGRAP